MSYSEHRPQSLHHPALLPGAETRGQLCMTKAFGWYMTVDQAVVDRWNKNEKMADRWTGSCGYMEGDTQQEAGIIQITQIVT